MNTKFIVLSVVILLVFDFLWIGLFMGNQYKKQTRRIQGSEMEVNYKFALMAYILMVVGLILFVLPNIREGREFKDSLIYGFTFGVVVYGVYDFTAGAVFKNWNTKLAMIDILWGGFVYFMASYIGSIGYRSKVLYK